MEDVARTAAKTTTEERGTSLSGCVVMRELKMEAGI